METMSGLGLRGIPPLKSICNVCFLFSHNPMCVLLASRFAWFFFLLLSSFPYLAGIIWTHNTFYCSCTCNFIFSPPTGFISPVALISRESIVAFMQVPAPPSR